MASNYEQLVKALRCGEYKLECGSSDCPYWSCIGCMDMQLVEDAAAAIEALQAEVTELKRVNLEIFEDLPKRGEWVEEHAGPGLSNYKCSLCGKICGTWRRGLEPSELPNWCGNCGADMRKMEMQDGTD